MRILLTGGSGQLGGELRRALAPLGLVQSPSRSELDLADAQSILAAVAAANPQLIVNAAAYTAVDRAESEPAVAMAVNGVAPGILAQEAARRGAGMLHYSTDHVFDGNKASPYLEDDATAPVNAYGASKLAGEAAIRAAGGAHIILRTAWLYGLRGENFMRAVLDQALSRGALDVVDDQYGSPTPARAVAEATAQLIAALCVDGRLALDRMQQAAGVFHMTAAGRASRHEFAKAILEQCGVRAEVRPVSSASLVGRALRPRNVVLDNDKLRTHFGIALPEWQAGLRSTVSASTDAGGQLRL